MLKALRSAARLSQRPMLCFNPPVPLVQSQRSSFLPRSTTICPISTAIPNRFHYAIPPTTPTLITRALSSSVPSETGETSAQSADNSNVSPPSPRNAKELPPLDEGDLEESFVKGSGPGGQKINKTSSCVILRHRPSGIVVKCQEHRSQHKNRQYARVLLQKKLDEIERGKESIIAKEAQRARARKARRRRKSVKKHFKSRSDRKMMDDF